MLLSGSTHQRLRTSICAATLFPAASARRNFDVSAYVPRSSGTTTVTGYSLAPTPATSLTEIGTLSRSAASTLPAGHAAELALPDGQPCPLDWRPERPCAYRIAAVDAAGRAGWWRLRLPAQAREFRLTVLEGLPLFLLPPPPEAFPYARVICSARGDGQRWLGARFEYFRGDRRRSLRDQN